MRNYYLYIPDMQISAAIEAPTTEKARTVLLDYLERTGKIDRSSRQRIRRDIIVGRPESLPETNLHLAYDYIEDGKVSNEVLTITPEPGLEVVTETDQPEDMVIDQQAEPTITMPIQRLALGLD